MTTQVANNLTRMLVLVGCAGLWLLPGCSQTHSQVDPLQTSDKQVDSSSEPDAVAIQLLQANSLDGWEVSNFGGEGECSVANGELIVEMGYPLSGVTSTREDLPTNNYEISLEAKRTQGIDFFCGLTFPVDDSHCTLIVGGWAGAVVGLSCVDGNDAARNETKSLMKFEDDRWYKIRVKVAESIEAWIDDKQVVNLPRAGRKFSVRAETLVCRPLGICTFDTSARYRNIELKSQPPQVTKGQSDD